MVSHGGDGFAPGSPLNYVWRGNRGLALRRFETTWHCSWLSLEGRYGPFDERVQFHDSLETLE